MAPPSTGGVAAPLPRRCGRVAGPQRHPDGRHAVSPGGRCGGRRARLPSLLDAPPMPQEPRMLTIETLAPQVHAVRARIIGELVLPDDPNWDEARRAWNL